jgi:allophanate hydrolase subunit 2
MVEWIKDLGVKKVENPCYGQAHLGFSLQGAMDTNCLDKLKLEYSSKNSFIWEVSSLAVSFLATEHLHAVLVGASRVVTVKDSKAVEVKSVIKNQIFEIRIGHVLDLGYTTEGVYSYLLLSSHKIIRENEYKLAKRYSYPIQVYSGLEVSTSIALGFCQPNWKVSSKSNRMGIRLTVNSKNVEKMNKTLLNVKSYPSNPVWDGVVQWTGSELIILHRDRATLGGYPRVLEICKADLSRIAQYRPGETLRFDLLEN